MAKPEWGTKRLCGACGARFYDLGRDPIVCPVCGTPWGEAARRRPAVAPSLPSKEDMKLVEEGESDDMDEDLMDGAADGLDENEDDGDKDAVSDVVADVEDDKDTA